MSDNIADNILAGFGLELPGELKHYGKKGMRWGVTRERGADGKVTGKATTGRAISEDHTATRVLKGKRQAEMSNAELERVNKRLQLERTNKDLQSRGALQKIKTGTAIAGTILAVGATANSAIQFAKSPAGQKIAVALGKKVADPNWLF